MKRPEVHFPGLGAPAEDTTRFDAVLDRLAFEARHVYLWGMVDDAQARALHRWAIAAAQTGAQTPVTLHINSAGGEVFAGASIIQSIRHLQAHGITVTGLVEGEAMSMASIILQACDRRIATSLSVIMCHGVSYWNRGDIKNARTELHLMEALTRQITALYTARGKGVHADPAYWETVLQSADPTYLLPDEALEAGLIDEVVP